MRASAALLGFCSVVKPVTRGGAPAVVAEGLNQCQTLLSRKARPALPALRQDPLLTWQAMALRTTPTPATGRPAIYLARTRQTRSSALASPTLRVSSPSPTRANACMPVSQRLPILPSPLLCGRSLGNHRLRAGRTSAWLRLDHLLLPMCGQPPLSPTASVASRCNTAPHRHLCRRCCHHRVRRGRGALPAGCVSDLLVRHHWSCLPSDRSLGVGRQW